MRPPACFRFRQSWRRGQTSLKAALAHDWDDPTEREQALLMVLGMLNAVEGWLDTHPAGSDAS